MVPKPPSEELAGLKGHNLYRRFFPNRFLAETYKIVDDPTIDHIISWNKEGSTFIVWSQAEFANHVLPKFFKHNNFTSFVRQIYAYGFRKILPLQNVSSDRWEFFNESFRRGEKHLLGNIRLKARRDPPVSTASLTADTAQTYSTGEQVLSANSYLGVEAPPAPPSRFLSANPIQAYSTDEQVLSPNSSRGVEAPPAPPSRFLSANLIDENDKLRRENLMLKEVHGKMKILCDGIKLLTCNYLASQRTGKEASPIGTTMELMPPVPVSDEVMDQTKKVAVARLFRMVIGDLAPEEGGQAVQDGDRGSGTGGSWKPS